MLENTPNTNSILSPSEILQLFIVTFLFVVLFGAIAILVGGTTLGLLSESLIIVPALLLVWRQKRPFYLTFRLHKINTSLLLHSFAIGIVVFVIGDELDRLIASIFPMPQLWMDAMEKILEIHSVRDAVVIFTTAVIFAGFAEEMLFRGMLQQTIEKYRDPAHAIVFTAILFAIIHFNPWTALQITFLGLILSYLAWKSNSILPAVILHACNNLFSIILMNLPDQYVRLYCTENHVRVQWIGIALIVAVPLFISYHRQCEQTSQQQQE
jgi:membrane protease YdiL (CAAX protease family)